MTATLIQSPDRVILRNISWQSYQSLIHGFEQEPTLRLICDRDPLENRMPLDPHGSERSWAEALTLTLATFHRATAMLA